MRRGLVGLIVAVLATIAAAPLPAGAQVPPPLPKAWIVVDADSGAVIHAGNDRVAVPAASVFKLFTALLTVESLRPGSDVPISARAEGMPARKINVKAGQVWSSDHLLHSLLMVSANDAAVALAERIGGSMPGFVRLMERTADSLGLADSAVLRDPAGLDDEFSNEGGNLISARDLAIITRAAMSYPQIMEIVRLPEYRFEGGDGLQHRLRNQNRFLTTYPGAVGMKTGYSKRSGRCLIAAATRDGRTLLTVVLGAADTYGSAARLLDQGFATPVSALAAMEHLPEVVIGPGPVSPEEVGGPVRATTPDTVQVPPPREVAQSRPWYEDPNATAGAAAVVGGAPAILILIRRNRRRVRRNWVIGRSEAGQSPRTGHEIERELQLSRR